MADILYTRWLILGCKMDPRVWEVTYRSSRITTGSEITMGSEITGDARRIQYGYDNL